MSIFNAWDGTQLACHVRGDGEPLVVLPGGPMRASAYLGDLGGLSARRRLRSQRCVAGVEDVEALRGHLGVDRMDVFAHSAGGSLAMLYAARYPERVRRLALVTATPWALGLPATPEDRLAAARLREDEPWFADTFPAFEAWLAGTGDFDPAFLPFFYGCWDERARAHAERDEEETNEEAAGRYGSPGAYDPPATRAALARLTAPVLVLAGELDGGPRPDLARRAADAFPAAEFAVQPGAGHYPWLDDPEWFVRPVADFLSGAR
ncbi:alpha/beta hydrolase [Streptomyces deserti]